MSGGKGGGPEIPKGLAQAQQNLINTTTQLGSQNAAREGDIYQYLLGSSLGGSVPGNPSIPSVASQILPLMQTLGGTREQLGGLTSNLSQDAAARQAAQYGILGTQTATPGEVMRLGGMLGNTGLANADVLRAIAPTFTNPAAMVGTSNLVPNQIAEAGRIAQTGNQVGQAGGQITGLAGTTGAELAPLRGQTLATLNQVAQGQMPTAISDLFTPGTTAARDVLEAQFQNARNRLTETSPTPGGNLSSNLAGLEANRALGLAQLEENRQAAARDVAANLFNLGAQQGLGAPTQQAALIGQGAGVLGQAGGLYGQAGGLYGQAGQQLLGTEQARQGALTGQLGALNTAAQQDMQALAAQQASYAQAQQLAQSLAGQYGAGADQLMLALPSILGQQASLAQGAAVAPAIPAQLLQGAQLTSPASYFNSALQGNQGLINSNVQAQIANQQAGVQNMGGIGNLVGTLGAGALLAFT